ncbi:hypothetical protein [Fervidibacillus albus]|uniref:Uncharacterized protein n=1 Tax=Fervidibacillus albus TaxID=2980026 RepID=A0A9E8LXZ4_9BACI|nr:hypothetical protein [Fervidibacillus albus]WAA10839.1 hypothetical protein OE104_05870 [Fervidibacillus albus]
MRINFEQLRQILKLSGLPVYRDSAPINATFPYIQYEFVNEQHRRASDGVLYDLPLYQIAVVTNRTEKDLESLKNVLNENKVYYEPFEAVPYDENDATITQFITYVRCWNAKQ